MGPASSVHDQFHRVVDEHYDAVRRYARFLTGQADAAEDVVHEAFLRLHGRLASGPLEGDAGKYLRGIVRNLVYDWWRAQRRMPQHLADRLKLLAEEADDDGGRSEELRRALRRCLDRLNPDSRAILAKRYEGGSRIERIADDLRLNVVTVRVRLHRIRMALRRCVEGELPRGGES